MAKKPLLSTATRPASVGNADTLDLTALPQAHTLVRLPKHPGAPRVLDFGKYYETGCDVVVYAAQRTLERMTESSRKSNGKTLSPSTIGAYFTSGLSVFFPFCATMAAALGRELRLEDIDRKLIDHFISYLRQSGSGYPTQKSRYSSTKSVLVAMGQSGWIAKSIFPRNPFPHYNRLTKGQSALSEPERKAVLTALRKEIRAIISSSGPLTSSDLSVCLLAISARTGINPTPGMELLIDCLQPHPLKADRYVLVSFKRRGNATHIQSLRRVADIKEMVSALPDVARIIDLIRDRNAEIRERSQQPASLFVYESQRYCSKDPTQLSKHTLYTGVAAFCRRHDLRDADGEPLKLNLMRMRKTFENRLFRLSGQDPFLTAKLGGHSPKISNDHYLEAPETAERDWHLMGEVRVEQLLSNGEESSLSTQFTPVAQCRDTLTGDLAPKNGEHCQKFLACFRCKSFVVTGDDLYRVFSLYWLLISMRRRMGGGAWKRIYGHIIRIIDREITPKFDAELVAIQRQRAKADPHPFWRDPELLEGAA